MPRSSRVRCSVSLLVAIASGIAGAMPAALAALPPPVSEAMRKGEESTMPRLPDDEGSNVVAAVATIRARVAELAADWPLARSAASEAIEADSEHPVALMTRAYANWHLGDFGKSASDYGRVRGSLRANALLWSAHSHAAAGEWSRARAAYEKVAAGSVIAWSPAVPGAEFGKEIDADLAILHWRRAARDAGDTSCIPHWLLGKAYQTKGRFDDATKAYAEALRIEAEWKPLLLDAAIAEWRSSGSSAAVTDAANRILSSDPGHLAAMIALAATADKATADARISSVLRAGAGLIDEKWLRYMASTAFKLDAEDATIDAINRLVLWCENQHVADLGDDFTVVLAELSSPVKAPGATAATRYVYAANLGKIASDIEASGNPIGNLHINFDKYNQPAKEDIDRWSELKRRIGDEARASASDLISIAATSRRIALLDRTRPHLETAIRMLRSIAAERVDFPAATITAAEFLVQAGRNSEAISLLEDLLKRRPDATNARLLLCNLVPLDKAEDLLAQTSPFERRSRPVVLAAMRVAAKSGDVKELFRQSLTAERDLSHFETIEGLGLAMARMKKQQESLVALEACFPHFRTGPGMIARASLRESLKKSGVSEAWIDAWRASDDEQARLRIREKLLARDDVGALACARCGGGGTISQTSGSTGEFGSVNTYQVYCPTCLGLGWWHAGAR